MRSRVSFAKPEPRQKLPVGVGGLEPQAHLPYDWDHTYIYCSTTHLQLTHLHTTYNTVIKYSLQDIQRLVLVLAIGVGERLLGLRQRPPILCPLTKA